MRIKRSIALAVAPLSLLAACTSSEPPPDTRPLGNVTQAPLECDLISANAIQIATGLDDYKAFGTKMDMGRRFESCTVSEKPDQEDDQGLMIEVFEPSPTSPEGLENTKVSAQGKDLPGGLGPGFAARRKNEQDQTIAFVYGWTPDHKRLLSINIMEGAPGRDSLADATEFFRQLKPILLDKPA
ncbi:hypothetical protein [Nonomuraea ceibae]|uniref:hypothetical protein n=1 Tax=Nonomuraea ceibae TaxID=1935170 RepID=UPI001C5F4DAB|nr:hypothetical protein [Nonomuraea ceibae]